MQISVIEEKENPLLNRRELQIKIKHEAGTPARIEVKNRVAAELKVEPQQVIVRSMKTAFGKKRPQLPSKYNKPLKTDSKTKQITY